MFTKFINHMAISVVAATTVLLTGGCSEQSQIKSPESRDYLAIPPCPLKDQNLCKERDILSVKGRIFIQVYFAHLRCSESQYSDRVIKVCGKRPEWRDFK